MRNIHLTAIAASEVLTVAVVAPLLMPATGVHAVPLAAIDVGHPGETGTINAAFKLRWQPTDRAALQELDDLAATGTHGITIDKLKHDPARTVRSSRAAHVPVVPADPA